MAQSYLIFDFGGNEEAAQQAVHRVEGWKQGFRLGAKLLLKFERQAAEKTEGSDGAGRIRLFVRLDFSDHEKLSYTRWLERIPSEAPFKGLPLEIIRHSDPAFAKTADTFQELT
jgi:hypothetical protein